MPRPKHPYYFWVKGYWREHSLPTEVTVRYLRPSEVQGNIRGSQGFMRVLHSSIGTCVRYDGIPIPVNRLDPLSIYALAHKLLIITEEGGNIPVMTADDRTRYLCGRLTFGKNTKRSKVVVSA